MNLYNYYDYSVRVKFRIFDLCRAVEGITLNNFSLYLLNISRPATIPAVTALQLACYYYYYYYYYYYCEKGRQCKAERE